MEFSDVIQLSNKLKSENIYNKHIIIGIDGFFGVGKTELAKKLSEILEVKHIEIDDGRYLDKNRGSYINNIDMKRLKADIVLAVKEKSLIVEGICLLNILKRINVKSDLLIYVKRTKRVSSNYISWQDQEDCEFQGNIEKKIRQEGKGAIGFNFENRNYKHGNHIAEKEVLQYHRDFKPHINADYIYYNLKTQRSMK